MRRKEAEAVGEGEGEDAAGEEGGKLEEEEKLKELTSGSVSMIGWFWGGAAAILKLNRKGNCDERGEPSI